MITAQYNKLVKVTIVLPNLDHGVLMTKSSSENVTVLGTIPGGEAMDAYCLEFPS